MKRLFPVILLITVLPTIVLVGAAVYVGSQFVTAKTSAAEEEFPGASQKPGRPAPSGLETAGSPDLPVYSPASQQPKVEQDDSKQKKSAEESWISLFDGKSLDGWEGNLKFFRVENGAIVAGNLKSEIPRNEFLCTKKKFQDFELRLQAKLIGEGKNAGIQFRSRRIPDHHEVIGYQCDMGQMKDQSIWGFLYDESRRRKFLTEPDKAKIDQQTKSGEWNDLVIRCEGTRVQIWLNDLQTVDYLEQDPKIAKSGIIGLQIHSGPPAEAWYRKIRIKLLNQ